MKKAVLQLFFAAIFPLVAASAQTYTPLYNQTRCGTSTLSLTSCSVALYQGTAEAGQATQIFAKGDNPIVEFNAYVQNPGHYRPAFQVQERWDANGYGFTPPPAYTPTQIVWSTAGAAVILDYVASDGKRAHIVYEYLTQRYGCGRSSCLGTFWTILQGTQFEE